MTVLSERPTIPADAPQPTLTSTSDAPIAIPDVVVNGRRPIASANPLQRPKSSSSSHNTAANDEWGSNFWVTLVDPQVSTFPGLELNGGTQSDHPSPAQTQTQFYACPATGQVSWDPPVGSFL